MLLNIDVSLSLWEKFNHFLSSELGHVSDVGKGLNLVEMHDVVHHPQVIVVVHSDVKGLHCFTVTFTHMFLFRSVRSFKKWSLDEATSILK